MTIPATDVSPLQSTCPSKSDLTDYIQGYADDSTANSIDAHLERCEACNKIISDLEVDLLPTLDQMQDETADNLVPPIAVDEDAIVREAIACSKLACGLEDVAWHSAFSHQIPEQLGPYRLLKPIGRGGMGSVYQARHQKLNKDVALKLLPLGMANPSAIERFEREIKAAGKLTHPAIVNSTDAGTDAGYLYLAMELVHGFDLGKIARLSAPLQVADVCEIGRQMALGLSHAHQMGMVHRDIKPSNVMLDTTGKVKLLDFGLVMLNHWDSPLGELTTVGQFLGTLDYMAPEQAERSASVDHRSDLYSLGATMFRLLTGQLPVAILPNQSPLEKLRVLSQHAPLKVTTLRSDTPEPLAKLLDQLLKTDPRERPASAAHVAESLDIFCRQADLPGLANRVAQVPAVELDEKIEAPYMQQPSVVQKQLNSDSGRSRFRWWWTAAAACLPFMIYLGWTVIIENSKGNLVIQSENDGLQVQLTSIDGEQSDGLTIHQGNSLTRLRAGKYELKIESPSDGIVLEPELVALKRGETVIAKIHREPLPGDVSSSGPILALQTPNSLPDWLPTGVISEDLLRATYKDKSILEHLRQVHLERDYATWLASVTILEQAVPEADKSKLAPFIQSSAERKGFLEGLKSLKLTEWIGYKQLDARLAQWLENDNEKMLEFLKECTSRVANGGLVGRELSWTELPSTWQTVEEWFASDQDLSRRFLVQQALRGPTLTKIFEIKFGHPLNRFLYAHSPATALNLAQYYDYPTGMSGYSTGDVQLAGDAQEQLNRIKARLKLAREAIANENVAELFWQLKSIDVRAEAAEAEFWKVVSKFIEHRLEAWAASDDLLMKSRVQIQLSAFDQSTWSVQSAAAKQIYAVMGGGMGGGMGGMGGGMGQAYTRGLPPGTSAIVSESVELLAAFQRLPTSVQPRSALEKVRTMLEAKDRTLTNSLKQIFSEEWSSLSWTSDMKLQRFLNDGSMQELAPSDQDIAIAVVMHRWIDGILESDSQSPYAVVTTFFSSISDALPSRSGERPADHWVHSSLRDRWSNEKFASKFAIADQASFEVDKISSSFEEATVVGRYGNFPGQSLELRVRLGFEREGWRITTIERFSDGKKEVLFGY